MNAEQLLHHFDQIADAPDAVARLRQFILDLAVRGKLVEQDPNDEPASELLRQIAAEKALIKGGRARSTEPSPVISEDKVLFQTPLQWEWAPLENLCHLITDGTHVTPTYTASGVPFISVNNFNENKISFKNCKFISPEEHKQLTLRCKPEIGDILLGKVGSIGVCDVVNTDEEFSIFVQIAILKNDKNYTDSYYLRYAILSKLLKDQIFASSSGTALQYISLTKIKLLLLPLPPLAEQHRIVAKVDELMALCDELEAKRAQRETRRDQLVAATLHSITNVDAGADDGSGMTTGFAESARFYFNHLPRLTTRPEHIKQLRQTILNLAVQGKLIANNSSDNSSWKLAKLSDCATIFNGRAYKQQELLSSGTPVIRIQNLNGGQSWYYSDLELDPEKYCDQGDLLYAWSGTFGPYIWGGPRGIYHYHIWKLKLSEQVEKQFVFYMLQHLTAEIKAEAHGLMLPHMTKQRMESWPVLLPPLAEQHHIVAKVNELMALCNELEARLSTNAETRRQLLEATLYTALAGQHEAEISL